MIVGTAGHIDHGKSALVRALTGMDPDRLKEEKARGITIDLGFAHRRLEDGGVVAFVDVPGHERFIHNMLAGAAGIDFVLLVVAADDGVMPQTREHLHIVELLGVRRGAVALTKIDLVDATRRQQVAEQAGALARAALGPCPVFPLCAPRGEGVDALWRHLAAAARATPPRAVGGRFRLAVDRCFALAGHGTVVTGTVFAGLARVGDQVAVAPEGLGARIRAIHAQGEPVAEARAGMRCALNLAGPRVDQHAIRRGDWIVAAPAPEPVERFDARLRLLAEEARPLDHWTSVHVHLGGADLTGRIALLQGSPLAPGDEGLVQVVLEHPTHAVAGDRFVVRDQSARRTLGGGRVLDPFPPARRRRTPMRLAQLAAWEGQPAAIAAALAQLPPYRLDKRRFESACNLDPPEAAALWADGSWQALAGGTIMASAAHWQALGREVLAAVTAAPLPAAELFARLARPWGRPLFDACIAALVREGRIARAGAALVLPQRVAATPARDDAWQDIEALLAAQPLRPMGVAELAVQSRLPQRAVAAALAAAVREGKAVQVAPGHYLLASALARFARCAEELGAAGRGFTLAEFHRRSGCGRRAAVAVLEYFDRCGYTGRQGEARVLKRGFAALLEKT
ncbi:MAG: selenocysteine-specific translation elongation factor [Pseudomonadota bacterium]